MRCYLFDLDGTVCDIEHRLHFIKVPFTPIPGQPEAQLTITPVGWKPDWDSFFAACVGDKPIEPICQLVRDLMTIAPIVFVSGRSDIVASQTMWWLETNAVPAMRTRWRLYMRKHGDHRPDHVVKSEILDKIIEEGWKPIMCFDDRKTVVDMWRARGIVCAQVAPGDF